MLIAGSPNFFISEPDNESFRTGTPRCLSLGPHNSNSDSACSRSRLKYKLPLFIYKLYIKMLEVKHNQLQVYMVQRLMMDQQQYLICVYLKVSLKMAGMGKAGGAVWTGVWPFACVGTDMKFQIMFKSCSKRTVRTCMRLFSSVRTNVRLQVTTEGTPKGAIRTNVGFLASVSSKVAAKNGEIPGGVRTVGTLVGLDGDGLH